MPKSPRVPGVRDPSFFGLPRRERESIGQGRYGKEMQNSSEVFRAKALDTLEDGTARFPRGAFSTDFPGIYSWKQFARTLKPALDDLGIKWQNYGIDPVDGFVMNFFSSEDAVAAKLAYEAE